MYFIGWAHVLQILLNEFHVTCDIKLEFLKSVLFIVKDHVAYGTTSQLLFLNFIPRARTISQPVTVYSQVKPRVSMAN